MTFKFGIDFFDCIVFNDGFADCSDFLNLQRYCRDFDLSDIDIMQRRKMSNASKAAFSLLKGKNIDMPIIFSSYEGEINRYFDLNSSLATDGFMSPLSFSLSVHNAIPGLLSISYKNNSEILAICSNFVMENALLQAYLKLAENNCKSVLCIGYFEALRKDYFTQNLPSLMCILSVKKGNDFLLDLSENLTKNITNNPLYSFVDNFSFNKSWQVCNHDTMWSYEC